VIRWRRSIKSTGLVRLVGALTPTLDFRKAPPIPIEQLVELVKETGSKAKSAAKAGKQV
jgi:hypothetical protein